METVRDFIFLYSKITEDGDCSHEIKSCLILGIKAMANLYSVLKSRDIILPTKFYLVKAMVFLVVIYGYESLTIKKGECWRIDAFELWCWRRLFESPLDYVEIQSFNLKGSKSWIFIGRTDTEAETPILLPPDVRADSLETTLMLEKIECRERWGQQRTRCLDFILDTMDMSLSKLSEQ